MKLTDIHVDRYGPLPRFTHKCEDNFEIFYGPNESGKTLLLEAILKLLAPDIDSVIPHVSRVDESPTGHVVVEASGTEQKLGNGTVLRDIADLSPQHLCNIFVIRDNDLRLRDEHEFYDSVTQQIGDLHTSEINAIQNRLVDMGRLTSVGGRDLSSSQNNDNAEDERNNAANLVENIRNYIEEAETNDLAAAEQEFIAVKTELQQCENDLATQEAAKIFDTHQTLTERLETYREATRQFDEAIDRSTLEQLQQLDRMINQTADEIGDVESKRTSLREERTQFETEKETVSAELTSLNGRSDDIDDVKGTLVSFRDTHAASIGASRGMQFAQYVALAGIGLGGVAAVLGNTVAGVLLAVIGVVAAGWYGLQHRSVTAAEQEREQVLQQARDAGLDVATIDEVGPAIETFHSDVKRQQKRYNDLEQKIGIKTNLIDEHEQTLIDTREEHRANSEEKQQLLQAADVADIKEYRKQVEAHANRQRDRKGAVQSLTDALGEPASDDPDVDTNIKYWTTELNTMITDVDENVAPDEYDSNRLATLRNEHEQLEQRKQELNDRLEEHHRRLREFDEQVQTISAQPFLDEPVPLEARSIEGLRAVATDLEQLVERIERDADIAREALDIFDVIQTKEEQKITDLFGEASRAADVFRTITDDRYTDVTYDPHEQRLQVHRNSQDVLTPRQLSHGTTEQLYLATRIGLAEQLLSSEPGFFILDDAFLPADRMRLQEGFDVLTELAENGWQILYFTAKDEVGNDLVNTHGLRCRTLDSLG